MYGLDEEIADRIYEGDPLASANLPLDTRNIMHLTATIYVLRKDLEISLFLHSHCKAKKLSGPLVGNMTEPVSTDAPGINRFFVPVYDPQAEVSHPSLVQVEIRY